MQWFSNASPRASTVREKHCSISLELKDMDLPTYPASAWYDTAGKIHNKHL